jgi:hypothetical protein
MAITSNDIANQSIVAMGGNQPPVVGNAPNFDNSTAGKALARLYTPCVQTVARQWEWDFSRNTIALTATGNVAPFPWSQEYSYPPNGIQVWQLAPAVLADPNNPLPINWEIANAVVGGVQQRVVHTNLANAIVIYNNSPSEATWDTLFREAVVRLLASELAIAIAGKPETSQLMLESGSAFESLAEQRQG